MVINGGAPADEANSTRSGLALDGGETPVLVCNGLGAGFLSDLVPEPGLCRDRGLLESVKFTTALPGIVGLSSTGLAGCRCCESDRLSRLHWRVRCDMVHQALCANEWCRAGAEGGTVTDWLQETVRVQAPFTQAFARLSAVSRCLDDPDCRCVYLAI